MKIGFVSLGCPKNLVDGEVMLGLAQQAGHEITASAGDAEVIVVNTCAFIDNAKQESIDAILEMARQKRDGSCKRLVVTGCLAERYREELKKEIPEIDALLGTGEVPGIVEALSPMVDDRGAAFDVSGAAAAGTQPLMFHKKSVAHRASAVAAPASRLPTYIYDADTPRLITTPKHFAYVKVAEGCDYTCAFCIIPTLRGKYRSRTADSIVLEGVYDKHRLVPFGEYLPLEDLMGRIGVKQLVHVGDGFTPGARPKPMAGSVTPGFIPLICYEGLFPGYFDRGSAAWIVNISNDAWFGRTSGPWQHLNLASYRAIEEGLPMVRATPTGVSAVIDAYGRPLASLGLGDMSTIDARLPNSLGRTPYSRHGDISFWLMEFLTATLAVRQIVQRRKS